jgi:hypothetical protein
VIFYSPRESDKSKIEAGLCKLQNSWVKVNGFLIELDDLVNNSSGFLTGIPENGSS